MYGFTAYGTNAYASHRPLTTISPISPIIKLTMVIWQNAYNVVIGWQNTYNINNTIEL